MSIFPHKSLFHFTMMLAWLLLISGGFWKLWQYANAPGKIATAQQYWPKNTLIERNLSHPTLVVFAHPQCPCTEATMGELARLMPHIKNKLSIIVAFIRFNTQPDEWSKSRLWRMANEISNIKVIFDENGFNAKHFGAQTSGQTFLYSKAGELIFQGGITPSRGHSGDNRGREAILSYFETGKISSTSTKVFGCSLDATDTAPRYPAGKIK